MDNEHRTPKRSSELFVTVSCNIPEEPQEGWEIPQTASRDRWLLTGAKFSPAIQKFSRKRSPRDLNEANWKNAATMETMISNVYSELAPLSNPDKLIYRRIERRGYVARRNVTYFRCKTHLATIPTSNREVFWVDEHNYFRYTYFYNNADKQLLTDQHRPLIFNQYRVP